MKKVKEILKKNKKIIIGVIAVLAIIAIALVVILFTKEDQEKKLKGYMEEIGTDFYENFYYEQNGTDEESRTSFVSRYVTLGIKVDLDNLSRYTTKDEEKNKKFAEMISEFKNDKTGEACNKENTRIIIYPQHPYGKKDYHVEIELDCGF